MRNTTTPELLILYGSQTGVAEEVGERIAREALSYGLTPSLLSLDQYHVQNQTPQQHHHHHPLPHESRPTVFVCSTTGQGDEPSNMKVFWKYLCRRSHNQTYLANLQFAVFGLGDSSYTKFNFVAKKLQKRLVQLGGVPLVDIGLGDDQHDLGPDGVLDPWLTNFWKTFLERFNISSSISSPTVKPTPKFLLIQHPTPAEIYPTQSLPTNPKVCLCPLLKNERVTAEDHFQDVRLFSIDTACFPDLVYSPGDVLVVQPSNLTENVNLFFDLFPELEGERQKEFYLMPHPDRPWASIPHEMMEVHPFPWTLDYIVQNYFDLQRTPKRYFFELLSKFTTSELEKEKLEEFSKAEGQEELFTYSNRPRRTTLEVLQDFPHATSNIPLEFLFDLFSPIRSRSFSIASSKTSSGSIIQILVAVVTYKTKLKKPRLGLCSNWLARLSPGTLVPVWLDKGSFKFPSPAENVPVIMVGPGTGVAPFRSLITDRVSEEPTELTLFFGCRFQGKDFYFRDEWEALTQKKRLRFFPAFSRENTDGNKVYVQQKIEEQCSLLWDLIENQGGYIFVAGNAKRMPIDVSDAFTSCFKINGCPHPENYMKHLVKSGRYQTEVWS